MPNSNPVQRREYHRKWIAKRRADYFHNKKCARCNSTEKLELHHIDPTTKTGHKIWSWSTKRREAEIKKCTVLCKKCHKEKTIKQLAKPLVHGTINAYNKKGCRCRLCKNANNASRRKCNMKKAAKIQ